MKPSFLVPSKDTHKVAGKDIEPAEIKTTPELEAALTDGTLPALEHSTVSATARIIGNTPLILSWVDYVQVIQATAVYPRQGNNLMYPVSGLINEIGEYFDSVQEDDGKVSRLLELGDCYWYAVAVINEAKLSHKVVFTTNAIYRGPSEILSILAKIAGIAKKADRDNNGIVQDSKKHELEQLLSKVITFLNDCNTTDIHLFHVLQLNAMKLYDRKERKVLKGDGDAR